MENRGRTILIVLGIALLIGLYYVRGSKVVKTKRDREYQQIRNEMQMNQHKKNADDQLLKKLECKAKWDVDQYASDLSYENQRDEAIKNLDRCIPQYRKRVNEVLKEAEGKHNSEVADRCNRELKRLEELESKVNKLRN